MGWLFSYAEEGGAFIARQPEGPPGKRVKRGRLHFSEEEVAGQSGEGTPGQVGPKPQGTGKFKQDGEREKFSSRLHREGSPKETEAAKEERADAKADAHQKKRADAGKGAYREKVADSGKETYREKETDTGKGGSREKAADSSTDTQREEGRTSKEKKSRQEKKQERAQSRAEHSAVRLEKAKEHLAAQKPRKPPGPARRTATGKSMRPSTRTWGRRPPTRPSCWPRPGPIRQSATQSGISGSTRPGRWKDGSTGP